MTEKQLRRFRQLEALTMTADAFTGRDLSEFDADTLANMVAVGLFVQIDGRFVMTDRHWEHLYARMKEVYPDGVFPVHPLTPPADLPEPPAPLFALTRGTDGGPPADDRPPRSVFGRVHDGRFVWTAEVPQDDRGGGVRE